MMNENEEDRLRGRLMSDEAVEDAVLRYLDENPGLIDGIAPARDLWPGIESRIGARVLPLATSPASSARQRRSEPRWAAWVPTTAAAALLICATASVTYVLTKRGPALSLHAPTAVVVAPEVRPPEIPSQRAPASHAPAPLPLEQHATESERPSPSQLRTSAAPSTRLASHEAGPDLTATYDQEIATLRSALDARRGQLDPATVATIEQNLHVIDNAIAQSRAALAKDPKSRFLGSQLDRSLAKKTDLLRTAALLPSA